METLKEIISVPETMVNMVQKLQYDVAAKEKVVVRILTTNGIDVNDDLFNKYHASLVESTSQYEIIKSSMESTYMPSLFKTFNALVNWQLDFNSNEITFTVNKANTGGVVVNTDSSKTIIVKVDEDLVNTIQGLQYEIMTREKVITAILTTPDVEPNNALFDKYQDVLASYSAQYDDAKNTLVNKYMPEELRGMNVMVNWHLDFMSNQVTFVIPATKE